MLLILLQLACVAVGKDSHLEGSSKGFAGALFGCSTASSVAVNTTKKLAMLLAPKPRSVESQVVSQEHPPGGWVVPQKECLNTDHCGSDARMQQAGG
jgi:hypothetical protein